MGAGIVGLAHAHEARRRGLRVVVLDRDERAVGASVRNFGHLIFTGVGDGEPQRCAAISRGRWLELGKRAGLHLVEAGTLVVARAPDELAVLEAVARDPERRARMLTAAEVAALAPIPTDKVIGGMHATQDLRVDPRAAAAGLAELLSQDPGAQIEWGTQVHDVEEGAVYTRRLIVRAPRIVVCPGPDYRSLPPALRRGLGPMTLCQLQMLRIAPPAGRRYEPALATGLSLIRYPAFALRPEAAELRVRIEREKPELVERGIHLLVTQLPDGDLVIGDTHTYGDTLAPFGEERLYDLLLREARALLGFEPEIRQRWHGIYPTVRTRDAGNFHITAPLPGVRVVENVAGIGMTLSFGQAPAVLDDLEGAPAPPQTAPVNGPNGQDTSERSTPARGDAARL